MNFLENKIFQIAIDGPVSAGKGTVAKLVAQRLGYLYVDTGAMYRATALLALRSQVSLDDETKIVELIKTTDMKMQAPQSHEQDGRSVSLFLDDEDVSWQIRTEQVSQGSSKVAVHLKVRSELVSKQQQIASSQSVVMEGRDVTYRVLPDADIKIFLTASDTVRAKRRHFQLLTKGVDISFSQVHQDLMDRDNRDYSRQADPLKKIPEAWVIDTSDLSIPQVVELIVAKVKVMQANQ